MPRAKKVKDYNKVIINGKSYTVVGTVEKLRRVVTKSFLVKDLYERWTKGSIVSDPYLQRMQGQWGRKQKSRCISTMLDNRSIGTVIIATGRSYIDDFNAYSLLDGLQRITTVVDFINNVCKLDKSEKPVPCYIRDDDGNVIEVMYEIGGKDFKSLPDVLQRRIMDYPVTVDSYENFSDEELDEIMFCVNNGKTPTSYQKMRFALGTENMRLIQPNCVSIAWEDVAGCREKNDSTLCSVLRGLMIYTNNAQNGLTSQAINKFIDNFDDVIFSSTLIKYNNTVEAFGDVKFEMTAEERELLDGCNLPHFIANYALFNNLKDKGDKTYIGFFREFIKSRDWKIFTSYSKKNKGPEDNKFDYEDTLTVLSDEELIEMSEDKSGSGGKQYSAESVSQRQYIIDQFLYNYLDCFVPNNGITANYIDNEGDNVGDESAPDDREYDEYDRQEAVEYTECTDECKEETDTGSGAANTCINDAMVSGDNSDVGGYLHKFSTQGYDEKGSGREDCSETGIECVDDNGNSGGIKQLSAGDSSWQTVYRENVTAG